MTRCKLAIDDLATPAGQLIFMPPGGGCRYSDNVEFAFDVRGAKWVDLSETALQGRAGDGT